jgi:hypothetical protein
MDQAHFRATIGTRLATGGRSAPTRQRQAEDAHLWVAACLGTALVPLRSVPGCTMEELKERVGHHLPTKWVGHQLVWPAGSETQSYSD